VTETFLFRSTVVKSREAEGHRELSLMKVQPSIAGNRETREGWPLLPVETEANGDTKSTNKKGSFLGWFVRLSLLVLEIFVLPWLL
jgi:hypothetical protein